jgi:hypothetical protein
MCATAFTTWFVSSVNSSVGTAVSIGAKLAVRYYAQSPARTILSVATVICREGVKFKVNAWVNKKWQKRKAKISNSLKLTLSRTFKWPKRKRRWKRSRHEDESVAIEAALKFQTLAKRRLEAARSAFKNAEMELHEAERELEDADRYVTKVQLYCHKTPQLRRCKSSSDIVFVEYPPE